MKKVQIFCDGSSLGNPGFGGWCAILRYGKNQKIISGGEAHTTNNRMELQAVIQALNALKTPCAVEIVSDSQYVCNAINLWLKGWVAKNFKNVKNVDLWQKYVEISAPHEINAIWVKGHNGHAENEECDKIAKLEAEKFKGQQMRSNKKLAESGAKKSAESRAKKSLDSAPLADLNALQKKIKYHFNDENLLRTALTHKSFDKHTNNERLEFLGDAVMDLIIGEYVFRTQEWGNEGDLTRIRAAMVNENSLANLANNIDLGKYLFISFSENRNNGRKKPSILSDAFEALMGAIYIDGGLESARIVAHSLLEAEYREVEIESLFVDYKSALQELTQAICGNLPKYVLLKSSGPDHSKKFTMQVLINGEKFATARGKSKKEAEQICAKIAYNRIKKEAK